MSKRDPLEDTLEARLADYEQRLAALESLEEENRELRAQLAGQAEPVGSAPIAQSTATPAKAASTLSRRAALARLGGVAAAAGVTATAAALATNVQSARAADGQSVILGQTNTESNITTLTYASQATPSTILAIDGAPGETGLVISYQDPTGTGLWATGFGDGTAVGGVSGSGTGIWGSSGSGNAVEGHSGSANGVFGDSASGTGVAGQSSTGIGVYGQVPSGTGVLGRSTSFVGVIGHSTTGGGVWGISSSGVGVLGASETGYDFHAAGTGRFAQDRAISHAGPPISSDGSYGTFEQIRDSKAMVWFSVLDSSNHLRWARPGLVNGNAAGGALNFLPAPIRMIGAGSPPGKSLNKGTITSFTLTGGSGGIPADATAVFGNATVLAPVAGPGFVTLTAKGARATTNSLNFDVSDVTISNFCMVALKSGAIDVHVSNNVNVKFIFDVVGYCL